MHTRRSLVKGEQSDRRTFAARLRVARETAVLTQEELAERISTNKGSVSRWERGETSPRGTALRSLAKALGTTVEWLRDGGTDAPVRTDRVAETPTAYAGAAVEAQGTHTGIPAALERLRRATAAVQGALVELEALAAGVSPGAAEAAGRAVQGVAVADLLRRTADALENQQPRAAPPPHQAQG
jgi:transcriptional regulator with XRE-family HTH domain